jgi:hypothetical protein
MSSQRVQTLLVLLVSPIVVFLCTLFGEDYTHYASFGHILDVHITDRFVALPVILIAVSIIGWIMLYGMAKFLKVRIIVWYAFYYWIPVILVSIWLLIVQTISRMG